MLKDNMHSRINLWPPSWEQHIIMLFIVTEKKCYIFRTTCIITPHTLGSFPSPGVFTDVERSKYLANIPLLHERITPASHLHLLFVKKEINRSSEKLWEK